MTDILQAQWRISDQAIANTVGDEMVVLHLGNGTYFGLDPVGKILWEALAGGQSPADACDTILERYDIDRATAEQDLRQFLGELAEGDLILQA
ncbi:PqqD family protein [Erythrobacter sp. BLCC-B19]|uniref:PqqD family protein n=1 Tax=Erythrobacter sp. BLCC-B19 TaxID=3025315 RepID=UPI00236165A3|nr:PqqD family protein [Erythrobacter sp. BLCC-B19]WDA41870.1 PqqD family protein [Erythrobacter sp. BLCC-B19]